MWNTANNIYTHIKSPLKIVQSGGVAQNPVLWKGNQLQIEIGRHLFAHFKQGLGAFEAVIADVDMAADRADAHGHCQIAITHGALKNLFDALHRL